MDLPTLIVSQVVGTAIPALLTALLVYVTSCAYLSLARRYDAWRSNRRQPSLPAPTAPAPTAPTPRVEHRGTWTIYHPAR